MELWLTAKENTPAARVKVDGLGNVTVDQGANVGPIINQTDINNSNILIQNNKRF